MFKELLSIVFLCFLQKAFSLPLNETEAWFRIAGGQPADIKDFPYQVSIKIGKYICGGAILNQKFILTAAHCIYDFSAARISVRAGSNYRDRGGISEPAAEIYVHPNFDKVSYDYDVALIRLGSVLNYDESIKPIKLSPQDKEIESGRIGLVTGYGVTSEDGPLADSLQWVELPLISTIDCQAIYPPGQITDRMFCAGYVEGGKDACGGDSGGPLVLDSVIVGIISYSFVDCAAPDYPGAYTKVSTVLDFINSIINE